jgi:hypothetical protein
MAGSVQFTVKQFHPQITPSLSVTDALGLKKTIVVKAEFEATAVVEVQGTNDADFHNWELGFTQTILKSDLSAHYFDNQDQPIYMYKNDVTPLPAFDGQAHMAPWDAFPTKVLRGNTQIGIDTWDTPTAGGFYWTKNKRGELKYVSGRDEFCTWAIAKHRITRKIHLLAWAWWEVQFATEVNARTYSGKPKGGKALLHRYGLGSCSIQPQLVWCATEHTTCTR